MVRFEDSQRFPRPAFARRLGLRCLNWFLQLATYE